VSWKLQIKTVPRRRSNPRKSIPRSMRKTAASSSAFDYFQNFAARMGWGTPSLPEATEYPLIRLSNDYWLMLSLYRNNWIVRRIVDLPAQDMTRAWPKLNCDIDPGDIQKFDRTIQRTYTPNQICRAIEWARLYGGAGALVVIKGHEDILDEPLDLDDVNPHSYKGLIPFDRWVGIQPVGEVADNYDKPGDWGLPEYYECTAPDTSQSFRVHASRVLRFTGPEVPIPELQAQIWWGISDIEVFYEELKNLNNSTGAIINLLYRANILARVDPALAQLLAGLDQNQAAMKRYGATMQAQNQLLSSQSMLVLGKDGDMKSFQYSFGGIAEVYAQLQMNVAGAAEMPVSKIFGRTITGLGQGNEADERYYELSIATKQNRKLRPQLDKLYPIICMSEFGEVPEDLDYMFPSIRVLTEEEKGELTEKASAPILASYNSGITGRKTTLKELRQLSDTTNVFSNITDEIIAEADDEPMLPGEDPAEDIPFKPNPERQLKRESEGAEDAAFDVLRTRIWHGFDVTIENPAGSVRRGHDPKHPWEVTMTHDYGYLQRTGGVDGDSLDCFLGPDPDARFVYVVHTKRAPEFKDFDEDKCMLDFPSASAAQAAFLANYDRPEHFGSMEKIPVDKFLRMLTMTRANPGAIVASEAAV
jgi:phage-related protein (TIGR01555 family)